MSRSPALALVAFGMALVLAGQALRLLGGEASIPDVGLAVASATVLIVALVSLWRLRGPSG